MRLIISIMISSLIWLFSLAFPVWAEKVTLTDIAGRAVEIERPLSRMILGESRLIYFFAVLDKENPFHRIVGWRDDLAQFDPEIYAAYLEKYPSIADIPVFGMISNGTFSIEHAVSLKPDALLMNLTSRGGIEESGFDKTLEKLGIPLLYVDFRQMDNIEPTLRLMGELVGEQAKAEEFIAFRAQAIKRVIDRIAQANPPRPVVFIERGAGGNDPCCSSFGNDNFGKLVDLAGGNNMARDLIAGVLGTVSPEQVIASNPDHYIATGSNWQSFAPGGDWVGVGYGADTKEARRKLENLTKRPVFSELQAIKQGNVHALWHQFIANPYQFVAIERMAKWLHPDLFADLDPEASFKEMHERFLPLPYKSGYFISLKDE